MNPSSVWMDRPLYEAAERTYYENVTKATLTPLADEVAKARQRLIEIRDNFDSTTPLVDTGTTKFFDKKLVEFQNIVYGMLDQLDKVNKRLSTIENFIMKDSGKSHVIEIPKVKEEQEDDDVDLFGSDSDDNETASNIREERLAAYNSKKSKSKTHVIEVPNAKYKQDDDSDCTFSSDSDDDENSAEITQKRLAPYNSKISEKPAVIAKSNIILDVKPWDDETDMARLEEEVRRIAMDGLVWGASKLVPLAYGIHKLQVSCVVEDEKVSVDALQETIEGIENYVQSVDIAAFNKI